MNNNFMKFIAKLANTRASVQNIALDLHGNNSD